jgi:hypothetical protein
MDIKDISEHYYTGTVFLSLPSTKEYIIGKNYSFKKENGCIFINKVMWLNPLTWVNEEVNNIKIYDKKRWYVAQIINRWI